MSVNFKHVMVNCQKQVNGNLCKIPNKIILNEKRSFDKNDGTLLSIKDKLCYVVAILDNAKQDLDCSKKIDELLSCFNQTLFKIKGEWLDGKDFNQKYHFSNLFQNEIFCEIKTNIHLNVKDVILNMKTEDLFNFILNKESYIALNQDYVMTKKLQKFLEEIKDLECYKETWKKCVEFEEKMKQQLNYSNEKSYQHLLFNFLIEIYENKEFERKFFKITNLF